MTLARSRGYHPGVIEYCGKSKTKKG